MPPKVFLITHPEALLTDAEKQMLSQGLSATRGGEHQREGQDTHEQESREHEENEADGHEEDD